jgi:predicted nucleic acid-binding protein
MTILDTNVISEMVKPAPSAIVDSWTANQPKEELFTTSITEAELLVGIELMPKGKRRDSLEKSVSEILYGVLAKRVLPFDTSAARLYAGIVASRQRSGRRMEPPDAQIAAVALSRGCALATRNTGDFAGSGVKLINPWAG